MSAETPRADASWDSHAERVLRNEADLNALRELVSETRNADRQLVEERINALRVLSDEQRAGDQREYNSLVDALEERRVAATDHVVQRVSEWRVADREARELQATEYARRLDVLNHAHEKQLEFQAQSVTRELWDADRSAQAIALEAVKDRITALENLSVANAARSGGYTAVYGWAIAGIGLLVAVIVAANAIFGG